VQFIAVYLPEGDLNRTLRYYSVVSGSGFSSDPFELFFFLK
jgi:hypothetical protein